MTTIKDFIKNTMVPGMDISKFPPAVVKIKYYVITARHRI
jgi:hypothetical protein